MWNKMTVHACRRLKKKHNVLVVVKFYLGQNRRAAWETAPERALRDCSQRQVGRSIHPGEGRVHAIKHMFLKDVSAGLVKLLLVTRNSRHHEGFCCFRYEETQELGP